jgi:RNase P subunit RPR2
MATSIKSTKMPHCHKFLVPNRSCEYKVHAQENFCPKSQSNKHS